MSGHGYQPGRLDLPFVGISTFGKSPVCLDWDSIEANVAIMGAPYDFGTQWRSGARFGPRSIREASTLFSFGHAGAYDHEDDVTYLNGIRIVDIGDADIIHTDTVKSHANIEHGVRKIIGAGALPVVLGGDHSINIPCINAFSDHGPIHVVQIDAHLDFVDERHGVRFGHGNPLRRAAEKSYVTGLTQIGIRNVSSTAREGYVLYYEVLDLLTGLVKRGPVVGVDLVEVAPDYDHTGTTAILAAQLLLNFIGRIMHQRSLT